MKNYFGLQVGLCLLTGAVGKAATATAMILMLFVFGKQSISMRCFLVLYCSFFNFALVLDMPGWLVAIAKAERNRIHCAIKKRPAKPYNFLLLSAFSSAPAAEFITSHNLSGSFQVSSLYDKRGQYVAYLLFFQKFDLRKQQKWQRD